MEGEENLNLLIRMGHSFSGRERNCCFLNRRDGSFANISAPSGLDFPEDGRGVAKVDWDQDGDLDLWISNRNAPQIRFMRNDIPAIDSYVALRLVGTQCNRDAIGARVEVHQTGSDPRPVYQTLRAGAGYLSQSSKWLHFGLGKTEEAELRVEVHWPGGPTQEIKGVLANHRYRITQGEPTAELVSPRGTGTALRGSTMTGYAPRSTAHIQLASRFILPQLAYHPKAKELRLESIAPKSGRPLLLNLWASWCGPCVKELSSFTQAKSQIDVAELDILALAVDGLDGKKSDFDANAKILQNMQYPFASGVATRELLGKLQLVHDLVFAQYDTLPVPTSFLIDGQGRLAAIYKGPVDVETVLQHVADLPLEPQQLRKQVFPFPGRWFHNQMGHSPILLADRLLQDGFVEDAMWVVTKPELENSTFAGQSSLRLKLAARLTELGNTDEAIEQLQFLTRNDPNLAAAAYYNLGLVYQTLSQREKALASFQQAVKHSPKMATAHYKIGIILQEQGLVDQAINHWELSVESNPDLALVHFNLGLAWKEKNQPSQAIKHLQQAAKINPKDPATHFLLAESYELSGNTKEAVEHYQEVVQLNPSDLSTATRLAWILATNQNKQVRNGEQAVDLARRACEATQYKLPQIIDVLAAACAEAGQFEQAIQYEEQALQLGVEPNLAAAMRERLELFRKQQPFHAQR